MDRDCRKTEQEPNNGCEGYDHDQVVKGNLREGEVRLAFGQVGPYEHHCRAGSGCENDQPRNV